VVKLKEVSPIDRGRGGEETGKKEPLPLPE